MDPQLQSAYLALQSTLSSPAPTSSTQGPRLAPTFPNSSSTTSSILSPACTHTADILHITLELRQETTVDFEQIARCGDRLFEAWSYVIGCKRCRTSANAVVVLALTSERLLTLYDAAGCAYRLTSQVGGGGSGAGTRHVPEPSVTCIRSMVNYGEMQLDGQDAALFTKTFLNKRLVQMWARLEELEELVANLLTDKGGPEQARTLETCQESVTQTKDRLMVLVGQMK